MELRNRLTELKRKTAVDKTEVEQASSDLKAKTVPLNLALVTLKKRRADAVAMHTNAMKVAQMNLMATTSDCMKMQSKSVKQLCRLFPMRRNDQNVFMGSSKDNFHGMSKTGEQFLAGVYHHLPSILAFTAPHPNSYDRIQPDTWSGAYLCWGKENKEAPLRTACPPGVPLDLVSNFEIKSFDGCANPHLGLAAIVAAGIDGLRRHLT
ncbi:glutamate-ammonia ligase [Zea mays]|uniref:Glutamate-ammonia ligase n=2 Tax=Zea mays TaxID=4577 RepID=A0A1D6IAH5_MAIZE|nr:glutamate-ammonia ligase [Zea mays]ONM56975.1 glutamate-ammonia ligase [Zea mays]